MTSLVSALVPNELPIRTYLAVCALTDLAQILCKAVRAFFSYLVLYVNQYDPSVQRTILKAYNEDLEHAYMMFYLSVTGVFNSPSEALEGKTIGNSHAILNSTKIPNVSFEYIEPPLARKITTIAYELILVAYQIEILVLAELRFIAAKCLSWVGSNASQDCLTFISIACAYSINMAVYKIDASMRKIFA